MNTGIIYDAITYSTIYFCRDAMYKIMRLYANKEEDIFFYYDKFREAKGSITPPDDLYPFFYFGNKGPTVITEYFRRNISLETGTLNDFINELKKVAYFKRFVVFYYLDEYKKDIRIEDVIKKDPVSVARAMVLLRDHGSKTDTFIRLFYDFESLTEELIQYFQILFHKLKILHQKNKNLYENAVQNFNKKENITVLQKSRGLKDFDINKQVYGVSLIQPFVCAIQFAGGVLIGYKVDTLSESSDFIIDEAYKHVNSFLISKIFSNETILDIINALTVEPLTITQLSSKLYASRTTVDRLVGLLYDNMALVVVRLRGNEKYYQINYVFFLQRKKFLIKKLMIYYCSGINRYK